MTQKGGAPEQKGTKNREKACTVAVVSEVLKAGASAGGTAQAENTTLAEAAAGGKVALKPGEAEAAA